LARGTRLKKKRKQHGSLYERRKEDGKARLRGRVNFRGGEKRVPEDGDRAGAAKRGEGRRGMKRKSKNISGGKKRSPRGKRGKQTS